ncbi:MAG: BatA domain-containing protein [Pseudomonadota bacterium]
MHLDFLHPALLGGLAMAALPLLIHLISRRKARDIRFAALEFVLRSTRRRARRIQLRQLLLLLLRTLLICAAVLAVASPRLVSPSTTPLQAPAALALCLDVSASMQARPGGRGDTLFELMVKRARQLVREQDVGLPLAVYLAGPQVRALIEPASVERSQVLRALDGLQPSNGTSDLSQCVQRAQSARPAGDDAGAVRVVVLTDGAAHAWSSGGGQARGMRVEILRLPSPAAPPLDNQALRDLDAVASTQTRASAVDVQVSVERSANEGDEARTVNATLSLGDRPLARVTALLQPGARARKSFMQVPLPADLGSEVVLRVSVEPDSLSFDDEVLLPLEIPRPVQVLVVNGDPQTVRHRDEVFYLERALSDPDAQGRRLTSRFVHAERMHPGDVAAADVVILANTESVSDDVARALVARVQAGGGLLITSGDHLDAEAYNSTLRELLPGMLRGAKDTAPLDDPASHEMLALEVATPDHPIFTSLGQDRTTGLTRVRTHGLMLFDPDSRAPRTDLLRFSNGAPALTERRVGSGGVLLLCTTVDRDWSDLAIRPGFLPLIVQSLLYLADALELPRQRRHLVGQAVALRAPRDAKNLIVVAPDGSRSRIEASGPALSFTATEQRGLYGVRADLGDDAERSLPAERFVVEVDARESDTRLIRDEDLAGALPQGATLVVHDPSQKTDRPLWTALLVLLVFALAGEALLSRRSS